MRLELAPRGLFAAREVTSAAQDALLAELRGATIASLVDTTATTARPA